MQKKFLQKVSNFTVMGVFCACLPAAAIPMNYEPAAPGQGGSNPPPRQWISKPDNGTCLSKPQPGRYYQSGRDAAVDRLNEFGRAMDKANPFPQFGHSLTGTDDDPNMFREKITSTVIDEHGRRTVERR